MIILYNLVRERLKLCRSLIKFFIYFLAGHIIYDIAGLAKKLESMTNKQFAIRDELKKVNRRMETLDEHIRHSGNFKNYRGQKAQYEKLTADKTRLNAEYSKLWNETAAVEKIKRNISDILNDGTGTPQRKRQHENAGMLAEKQKNKKYRL